ncbi:hypothetical protein CcCBS67573_g02972 [Chytriomyces confervae]|uniref:non-specific serine/threonine protein kinase n=1 Tax=Chytriomyces confervae TaxID=246404 RepID=A0A507FHJ5_9FUNG|nr:hypothetical protein CcCBS67573_g02972 [Chytriomyces confervae]
MFKLLKKSAIDSLIAKTKNLAMSSRPQSGNSSKPATPKEFDASQMTLAQASQESLAAESVDGSSQSLSMPSIQEQSQAPEKEPSSRTFDMPGVLSIRIVETRDLGLAPYPPIGTAHGRTEISAPLPYLVLEFDKTEAMAWGKEYKRDEEDGASSSGNKVLWNFRANFDVSRETDLSITVYQKNVAKLGDMPLGTVKITPAFDQRLQDEWFSLMPVSGNNANKTGTPQISVGQIRIQIVFRQTSTDATHSKGLSVDDFEILKVLGKGSFGKVVQVRKKDTGRIYAMKILKKSSIVERDEVQHTLAERNVLAKVSHPFIVNIKFSFQSKDKLYLVLAFVNGGELFHHLQLQGKFKEERAKLYAAELLSALECLHSFNIIYRDLKPENILLDYTGHIALCDFGLCKFNMKDGNKTNTFCGTPEYLAPELLLGHGYTKCVDWWTLGVLIYEMTTGLPPFYDENQNEMYKRIVSEPLSLPDELSADLKDLLSKMLDRDQTRRLGTNGAEEIKKHPFFAEINWQRLNARKYRPTFRPEVKNAADTSNFDEEFTSEAPQDSYVDPSQHLADHDQNQFAGFSYRGDPMGSVATGSLMSHAAGGGQQGFPGSIPRGSLRREGNLRRWE